PPRRGPGRPPRRAPLASAPRPPAPPPLRRRGRSIRCEAQKASRRPRSLVTTEPSYGFGGPLLREFLRARRSDVVNHALPGCPEPQVVGPRLAETQRTIRATAALVRVAVVLPVVLPEADLADFERGASASRSGSGMWAAVRSGSWAGMGGSRLGGADDPTRQAGRRHATNTPLPPPDTPVPD